VVVGSLILWGRTTDRGREGERGGRVRRRSKERRGGVWDRKQGQTRQERRGGGDVTLKTESVIALLFSV